MSSQGPHSVSKKDRRRDGPKNLQKGALKSVVRQIRAAACCDESEAKVAQGPRHPSAFSICSINNHQDNGDMHLRVNRIMAEHDIGSSYSTYNSS